MNTTTETAGAAIVCDLDGVIIRIAHDDLGITDKCTLGTTFAQIVDPACKQKADDFISAVHTNGGAFGWQLCVVINGNIVSIHCTGFHDGNQLWITIANSEVDAAQVLQEMSLIQNEQTGMLRELAQKNVELESLRAKLEIKQTELMAANAQLDALATNDDLTAIANRRTFQLWLETECSRSNRYHSPLALLLLDVDHFKSLNDTYGHQAGDEVLKMMGHLLATKSRNTDLVARYGGEEFAVILVNTDSAGAREAGERLRARIETEKWPHHAITASIGIASWGPTANSVAELITHADKALYFSKKNGRNRSTHSLDMKSAA